MRRRRRFEKVKTFLPEYEINEELSSLSQRIDWGLKQLNVPATWSITKGEGITAMVIDTGHPVHPDIGDNVLIAAGSKILGNIKIESNVNIGANSVVLQSVPSYTTVVGIPGHIVKQEGRRIGKTFDHRNLPDPLYEQIKHLERQLEKAKNGEIQDDYII